MTEYQKDHLVAFILGSSWCHRKVCYLHVRIFFIFTQEQVLVCAVNLLGFTLDLMANAVL